MRQIFFFSFFKKTTQKLKTTLVPCHRKLAASSDEKNSQLKSHISVLEGLLESKKAHVDYVESKLEAMGLDPIAVAPFESDESEERLAFLKQDEEAFEARMKTFRDLIDKRHRLIGESSKTLQAISDQLEEIENMQE